MKQTVLLFCLLLSRLCVAETFIVPASDILDHGDTNTPNSIAWYFEQYNGAHTFILSTPGSQADYWLETPLSLPAGSTLIGQHPNRIVKLTAGTQSAIPYMLKMNRGSTVRNLTIDGNAMSRGICVIAGDHVTISDNELTGSTEYGITMIPQ